jgi:hypothetical protein
MFGVPPVAIKQLAAMHMCFISAMTTLLTSVAHWFVWSLIVQRPDR